MTAARAHWRARLPLPCFRCGQAVLPEHAWHVEHVLDRHLGGSLGVENQWVSHAQCNMSAGGRIGAALTNSKRPSAVARAESERERNIRAQW